MQAHITNAAEADIYASAALAYLNTGWASPLPVPVRSKDPVPVGYTGWHGITPSRADIETWREDRPGWNVALRMPANVLGIDVDAYGDKRGAQTLAECEERWGTLPPTWRSTSRDDGISGIRLFLIPPGLEWPSKLPGGSIELIHSGYRYVVAPPSIHKEGRRYRWIDPDGVDSLTGPLVTDLPRLALPWITGLPKGLHVDELKLDMPRAEVSAWLADAPGHSDPRCSIMARYTTAAITGMTTQGSRHDHLLPSLLQLVRFGASGHRGLIGALREVRQAFLDSVTLDKSRSIDEAMSECERALAGAVALVAANPNPDASTIDPCRPPVGPSPTSPPAAPPPMLDRPPEFPTPPLPMSDLSGSVFTAPVVEQHLGRERTSWFPVDLEPALRGEHAEAAPSVLARVDGLCLLYAGRINGIIGPSESGKSWVALEAIRQVILAGHKALLLDFEDSVPGVVGRLLTMDIDPDVLRRQFRYVGPNEGLAPFSNADLDEALSTVGGQDLIVLDGFNAAMTLLGLDLMSNRDVTAFYQALLKKLAQTQACVVYVDHTPKNDMEGESKGGIGAQAKRAMTTGSILKCTVNKPFGRGETGRITIKSDKDRAGHVRQASPAGRVGQAVLVSSVGGNHVSITIEPHTPDTAPVEAGGYFRPTSLMRRVSDYLAMQGKDGASGRSVRTAITGKDAYVLQALDALVLEGYVIRTEGIRGAVLHVLDHPYLDDLPSSGARVPHVFPPVPGNRTKPPVPVVPTTPQGVGTGHQWSLDDGTAENPAPVPALFDESGDTGDDE